MSMWILNQNVHINELEVSIPVNESDFVWQPVHGSHIKLVTGRNGHNFNNISNGIS